MKMKFNLDFAIKAVIGCVGYGVWAYMAYLDPSLRADFLKLNMAMTLGTIGLVLRDMKTTAPPLPMITTTTSVGNLTRTVSAPVGVEVPAPASVPVPLTEKVQP